MGDWIWKYLLLQMDQIVADERWGRHQWWNQIIRG